MESSRKPRIAVIGCGAIAVVYHLPALLVEPALRSSLILVDSNESQLDKVAQAFEIKLKATDYRDLLDDVDGVVIATPPETHHPIAMDFLKRGVHVLCEKPLTESLTEATDLVRAAEATGATLAVNHPRRLFPTYGKVRQLITEGVLGELQSITYHDGVEFNWPAVSAFHFAPGSKGVLSDTGIHLLDTVCWWLDARPELVASYTDSFGGPEAVAAVYLRHRECAIEIKVSRLTRLANRFCVVGSRGRIEADHEQWSRITVQFDTGETQRIRCRAPQRSFNDFGRPMLRNFLDTLAGRAAPLVPGASTLAGVELLELAYRQASSFEFPWNETLDALYV